MKDQLTNKRLAYNVLYLYAHFMCIHMTLNMSTYIHEKSEWQTNTIKYL